MTTVIDHSERGHSPLGASGAERWMNCPGSVTLLKNLDLPESDDPSYRETGTAMHEAGEHCLRQGLDAWEIVGETFNNVEITDNLATAIQVYLDVCRRYMDFATVFGIEEHVSSPVHPDFYGTADFWAFVTATGRPAAKTMADPPAPGDKFVMLDLKGGEGIIVEPDDNPQIKYYAFGVVDGWERQIGMELHPDIPVELGIAQPRAYHPSGETIRTWPTTVGAIKAWVHDVLVPAMNATETDNFLDTGPWCRFCPAKLVCPMLTALFKAAATADPKQIVHFTDEQAAENYRQIEAVKFYLKALQDDAFRRLNAGHSEAFEGVAKLTYKKSDRVFNAKVTVDDKEVPIVDALRAKFGDEAFTDPTPKTPAQIEKRPS